MDESDEEIHRNLIAEVASLDNQLYEAGRPCNEKLYAHLFKDLDLKPVAKRLRLWRMRRDMCKEMVPVASLPSRSDADRPAAASTTEVCEQKKTQRQKIIAD